MKEAIAKMVSKNMRTEKISSNGTPESMQVLVNGIRALAKILAEVIVEEIENHKKGLLKERGWREEISTKVTQQGQQGEKLTFTIGEVANLLGLSRNLTYEAVRTGQIPGIKIGRRIFIPRMALINILGETESGRDNYAL